MRLFLVTILTLMVCHAGTHDLMGTWVPHEYLPAPFYYDADVVSNTFA
jgi:hypothetical protein